MTHPTHQPNNRNSKKQNNQHNKKSTAQPHPKTAREIAFCVLDQHFRTGEFAAKLLDSFRKTNAPTDATNPQASREHRLAAELTYTVIRRQATLDALIQPYVSRPRDKVEDALWMLLQLGTTQLIFTDHIPQHAALNETVAVAKRFGQRGWSGFVNGVLRSISRSITDEIITDETETNITKTARNLVPLNNQRYRKLTNNLFPNPQTEFVEYIAKAFSFPIWLVERWQRRFSPTELTAIAFWFNRAPQLTLRVNRLETSRDALLAEFTNAGIIATPGQYPAAIHLESSTAITELPGFAAGQFTVQDESAMQAAEKLAPQPGETVLDLCAAPGTKTTHLAEIMQNQGTILATDIKTDRLKRVTENAERLNIDIIETRTIRPDLSDLPQGPFNAILVDAPCSNTGVLGKRPEARWRLQQDDLQELPAIQKRLLTAAIQRLAPNGRILYSTCSIEPEENNNVVQAVLNQHNEITQSNETVFTPGHPFDGGYQTVLQK